MAPLAFDDIQQIATSLKEVAFARPRTAVRIDAAASETPIVASDPGKLPDNGEPYIVVREMFRNGNPHFAVRRINAEMEVLDVLANDLDRNIGNDDEALQVLILLLHEFQHLYDEAFIGSPGVVDRLGHFAIFLNVSIQSAFFVERIA